MNLLWWFHPKIQQTKMLVKCVKGLVICFFGGWFESILQFRLNMIKVGSKSWLLTCSSNITLNLPSYTGSALKRALTFCNGYLSLLYFWFHQWNQIILLAKLTFLLKHFKWWIPYLPEYCKTETKPLVFIRNWYQKLVLKLQIIDLVEAKKLYYKKGKFPEVPFHRITSLYSYFEFLR